MKNRVQFFKHSFICLFMLVPCFCSCTNYKKLEIKDTVKKADYEFAYNTCEQYLREANFSGSILVAKKNKVIFAKAYGYSNPQNKKSPENTVNTVYEAGSLIKQFTAVAILQLNTQKKLSLDDKIIKYFPDFSYGSKITIRMLLTMRSGLVDCINAMEEFFPKNVGRSIEKAQLTNKDLEKDIVLKYLTNAPLIFEPDSTYFYSNTNYYLLAKIVEIVSGMEYGQYLRLNIFDPCGLTSSNVDFQNTSALGYDYKGRYYSIPHELAIGCGDLNTSVVDLYKWTSQLTGGKVLGLGKKGFKQMWNPAGGYGFGLFYGQNTIFHGGNTNVFNSYMCYHFDTKIQVIVLANSPINACNAAIVGGKVYKIFN